MPIMTGGRYIAEFLEAAGVTAVFFVPTILSRPLAEMDDMAIKRVLTHGEKAAKAPTAVPDRSVSVE